MIKKEDKIYIVSNDVISKNLTDKLRQQGYKNILTTNFSLNDKNQLKDFFIKNKPDIVILDPDKETDQNLMNRISYSASLNKVRHIVKFNNFFHQRDFDNLIINIHYDITYSHTYNEDFIIYDILREMHDGKFGSNMFIDVPGGSQKLNILHMDDLTDGILFILKQEKTVRRIYNINNCCEMNMRNIVYSLKEIVKFDGNVRFIDDTDEIDRKNMLDINDLGWKSRYNFDSTMRRIYHSLLDRHKYFMVSSLFSDSI